jgi:transglutaminase-like putative cysteine protease
MREPKTKRDNAMDMTPYLAAGDFIDSDAPSVIAFARATVAEETDAGAAVLRLYTTVRDSIIYDPYLSLSDPTNYRASGALGLGRGFCIGKAALLAACVRVIGVPARVGFADVRNHLTSPRIYEKTKSDRFNWHSYTELYLAGRWVKATPAFDSALCDRIGIKPLPFDGETDSLFQPFDQAGRRHMEYLNDRGAFADVPFDTIVADFRTIYPSMMESEGLTGDFRSEAVAATLGQPQANEKVR